MLPMQHPGIHANKDLFASQSYIPSCTPSLVPGARLQILADTASVALSLSLYLPLAL
jgi:hypothetical protein